MIDRPPRSNFGPVDIPVLLGEAEPGDGLGAAEAEPVVPLVRVA